MWHYMKNGEERGTELTFTGSLLILKHCDWHFKWCHSWSLKTLQRFVFLIPLYSLNWGPLSLFIRVATTRHTDYTRQSASHFRFWRLEACNQAATRAQWGPSSRLQISPCRCGVRMLPRVPFTRPLIPVLRAPPHKGGGTSQSTSQRPHPQTPSPWALGFQHEFWRDTDIQPVSLRVFVISCLITNDHEPGDLEQHTLLSHSTCASGICARLLWVICWGKVMIKVSARPGVPIRGSPGEGSFSHPSWVLGRINLLGL